MAAYDDRESARILAASPAQAAAAPAPRDCGFMGVFCLELPEVHVDIDVHTALDVVGMIPVIGTGADVINAGLYAAEGDYVNAGLSLVSAVPLVGDAVGAGKLAAKYGDDVAGLVASHADEAAAAVSDAAHFGDDAAAVASSTAKVADDAATGPIRYLDDATAACSFTPETTVVTPSGDRPIGELAVGDEVLARDEHTGATSVREIEAVLVHADLITGTVVIDGEAIETTPEHPFFSLDRGFVPASDLRPGELVATASGEPGVVSSVTWAGGPAVMWNLTVGIDHTFFVGAGGWWVHNACKPGQLGDLTPDEVASIQRTVDEAGRPLDVVGSAARGERRGVGTDLPIGRGPGTRSDIDYTTAGSNVEYFHGLPLPNMNPKDGLLRGAANPFEGPSVRFEPGVLPWFVPGH